MNQNHNKACVYTCIIGNYEEINEQPIRPDSELDFICLTDNPSLKSNSWKIVPIDLPLRSDVIRSQRLAKILPHKFLPKPYTVSLYIDNTVLLKTKPEEILSRYLNDTDFALLTHSYRQTVLDEFIEVSRLGLDDQAKIFEQLNHYAIHAEESLLDKPYWTGFLMRRHCSSIVQSVMERWAMHVLRYSRRDQLSFNIAISQSGFHPKRVDLDVFETNFHSWPHRVNIERENVLSSAFINQFRVEKLLKLMLQNTQRTSLADKGFFDADIAAEASTPNYEQQLEELKSQLNHQSQVQSHNEHLIHELTAKLNGLQNKCDSLSAQLTLTKEQLRSKKASLNEMRSTLSWKSTRQFRKLSRHINDLKTKLFDSRPFSQSDNINQKACKADAKGQPSLANYKIVETANGRRIYYHPDDLRGRSLAEKHGVLSPATLLVWNDLLKSNRWSKVYDIGANYGELLVNVNLPSSVSKVIAVEPNPYVLPYLKKTLCDLDFNVELLEVAVSDNDGNAIFESDCTWSGMAGLAEAQEKNANHEIRIVSVQTKSLKTVLEETSCRKQDRILMKIDIEGHEVNALRDGLGCLNSLSDFAILIEVIHLELQELQWLLQNFSVRLYHKQTGRFDQIDTSNELDLKSKLDGGLYHEQDVVLCRKE